MQKTIKTITSLLYIFAIFSLAAGCKTSQFTAEIPQSPISVSIDLFNVVDDKVKVEVKIQDLNTDTISYYLPKIVPGTYQNNNYGKYIEEFKALDKQGNALSIKKHGDNRWKINNVSQLDKITYWVPDTFDSEDSNHIFSPTGINILKNQNFVLNLYALIGYFTDLKENTYNVFIKYPKKLKGSTSAVETIFKESLENINYDVDFFSFKRYADVADSPIMYSDDNQITFTVNGIEILLSIYSPNKVHKASRIMPQIERIIRAQKNFLGDINTTKKYSILLYLSTLKSNDAKGFGALEHNTSTVAVLPESLSREKLNEALTDVISHEFFHIVTPLTIHSEEIHDFNYNSPKMSEHIWLYEGTTEYFSLLFQITQGLITKKDFFERLQEKIEASKKFDDTMSFTTMSKNILEAPYRENYRNVYEKGALISMCLDIIMREKSYGQYGILDLVKTLSSEFGINTPFEDKMLINTIKEFSYPEIKDFLEKHVVGNTPIDYGAYLEKVGVIYGTENVKSSYFIYEQQPFVKGSESTKEVTFIPGITYNNFLNNLGILGGDVLLSINDKKYNLKNIYDLFGDSNQWKIGDKISFKIKRNENIITLTSTVIAPTVEKTILQQNPNATEKQLRLLKNWIND